MKSTIVFTAISLLYLLLGSCNKGNDDPVRFKKGFFPDSVLTLTDLNSTFDDYNMALPQLSAGGNLVFSSNRTSQGGRFDIVQGGFAYLFNQIDGSFNLQTSITDDPFIRALLNKINTEGDDFGPYRFFSKDDGHEYMVVSSANNEGNLDLRYIRNMPQYGSSLPQVEGPFPVSRLNTGANDAYFCLDLNQDTAYLCSDRNGNFDIFLSQRTGDDFLAWFDQPFMASVAADSINSSADDKCPYVHKNVMVFASDRPGGQGGLDLYYSVMRKGKWSAPKNFGPGINTASNEYRPVIGTETDFTNFLMIFSSDRPGGKGGYDLYMTGVEFER